MMYSSDAAASGNAGVLEDFFENGAIALHVVGGDGLILCANKTELDLLGYASEDYIGRHIADFHVDGPVIGDILARLLRGETIRRYPARLRARDGTIKHVEITSSGQFINGNFLNTRCFTVDVSDLVEAREEARRKDDHLRQVLDALPAAVFMVDAEGTLTYVNASARALLAHEPRIGEDSWHSTFRLFDMNGEVMPHEQRPMTIALKENRPVWGVEALTPRPDGSFIPIMPFPTPIRDESGALTGAVNMFVDMSERKQAEDMFSLAMDSAPCGMILTDADGRIVLANGEAEYLFGYSQAELVGETIEKLVPPQLRANHASLRRNFVQQPAVRSIGAEREILGLKKDGTEVPLEIGLSPFRMREGLWVLSTIVDISERKRAAEREKLLVRELQHRSGNMFAVINAIVTRSLTGDITLADARRTVSARLNAMARTHQQLGAANWGGLDLADIVRAELEPYHDRIEIEGTEIVLPPDQAQNFSLALHELATNAAKYGALSIPSGIVEIKWSVSTQDTGLVLQFEWRECHGPAVTTPTRQGFGSQLLANVFQDVRLDFRPAGLHCSISVTLMEGAPLSQRA